MIVLVSTLDSKATEELRSLRSELQGEEAWRGRVELVERPPAQGTLGPVLEALQLVLEPGTAAPFLAALVAWLRWRTSDIELTVRRTDDSTTVTLSGKRLKGQDAAALTADVDRLSKHLSRPSNSSAD
ncbi:hypothetical protein ACIQ7Q_21195 [Streptomyces sp. NPDC096176]|uniref:effector-associated constant component EACC1 n=1 Tax=Streptomyces sp. NPDC096176 TaxID=3366079 RepID=UPI00380EB3A1